MVGRLGWPSGLIFERNKCPEQCGQIVFRLFGCSSCTRIESSYGISGRVTDLQVEMSLPSLMAQRSPRGYRPTKLRSFSTLAATERTHL